MTESSSDTTYGGRDNLEASGWPCVITGAMAWSLAAFQQGSRTWPSLPAGTLVVADCGNSATKDWRFYTPPQESNLAGRARRGFASLDEWERHARNFVRIFAGAYGRQQ